MKLSCFSLVILLTFLDLLPFAHAQEKPLPHLTQEGHKSQLLVNGKPFIMLAGEVHNSSSSSLKYMDEHVWPELVALNCNTAIVTISWELFEPEEGQYDTSLIDGLIESARQHNLKLVVIWFASWKNAWSTYAPAWVKQTTDRFPRAQLKSGDTMGTLSALGQASCAADAGAFAALMRRIREIDAKEQTVIMMQVENETGILNTDRDYSPLANKAFGKNVPQKLIDYLLNNKSKLHPDMQALWEETGFRTSGIWSDVFGEHAPEVFMAWHTASSWTGDGPRSASTTRLQGSV